MNYTICLLFVFASCISTHAKRQSPSHRGQLLDPELKPVLTARARPAKRIARADPTATPTGTPQHSTSDSEDVHDPTGKPRHTDQIDLSEESQVSEETSVGGSSSGEGEVTELEHDGETAHPHSTHKYRLTYKYNDSSEFHKQRITATSLVKLSGKKTKPASKEVTKAANGLFTTKCTEGLYVEPEESAQSVESTTLEATNANESTNRLLNEQSSQSNLSAEVVNVTTSLIENVTTVATTTEAATNGGGY